MAHPDLQDTEAQHETFRSLNCRNSLAKANKAHEPRNRIPAFAVSYRSYGVFRCRAAARRRVPNLSD